MFLRFNFIFFRNMFVRIKSKTNFKRFFCNKFLLSKRTIYKYSYEYYHA
jgi:hypothetical protein